MSSHDRYAVTEMREALVAESQCFDSEADQSAFDEYVRHLDAAFDGDDQLREDGRRLAADAIRDRRKQGLETDETDLLAEVHPQLSARKYGPEPDEIAAEAEAVRRGLL